MFHVSCVVFRFSCFAFRFSYFVSSFSSFFHPVRSGDQAGEALLRRALPLQRRALPVTRIFFSARFGRREEWGELDWRGFGVDEEHTPPAMGPPQGIRAKSFFCAVNFHQKRNLTGPPQGTHPGTISVKSRPPPGPDGPASRLQSGLRYGGGCRRCVRYCPTHLPTPPVN